MVASLQAVWYALMAASMAFFWAVEPSPLSVPLKQLAAAAEVPPVAAPPALPDPLAPPELLSLPQAESAKAPVKATAPARTARRLRKSRTGDSLVCRGFQLEGAIRRLSRPAYPSRTLGGLGDRTPPLGERPVNAGQSLGAIHFSPGRPDALERVMPARI